MRELRFGRLVCFKLIKDLDQLFLLIGRKKGEDPLFCCFFSEFLCLQSFLIIRIGVTRIDLHDIMEQAHQHDLCDIDRLIGIFLQKICHYGHVPCMLCIVLVSSVSGQMRLPEDVFFFINFQGKCQLLFKTPVSQIVFQNVQSFNRHTETFTMTQPDFFIHFFQVKPFDPDHFLFLKRKVPDIDIAIININEGHFIVLKRRAVKLNFIGDMEGSRKMQLFRKSLYAQLFLEFPHGAFNRFIPRQKVSGRGGIKQTREGVFLKAPLLKEDLSLSILFTRDPYMYGPVRDPVPVCDASLYRLTGRDPFVVTNIK